MTASPSESNGRIIRDFLALPLNRTKFDAFFALCYSHTLGYLRYLQQQGYRLPVDQRTDKDPLTDLAIDLLGYFLARENGGPSKVLIDFYRRQGIDNPTQGDPAELYDPFTVLLRGFVRKQLSRLTKEHNPQLALLKRRFNDVLRDSSFTTVRNESRGGKVVCLSSDSDNLALDKPPIPDEELRRIVQQAYLKSNSRQAWCRTILEDISTESRYCNGVLRHRLLSAVVATNASYADLDGLRPSGLDSPQVGAIKRAADSAIEQTLEFARQEVVLSFVEKGRLISSEVEAVMAACRNYLCDFGNGDTESIPTYFRSCITERTDDQYERDYKYVFDTLVKRMVANFQNRMKKNPTVSGFGDY